MVTAYIGIGSNLGDRMANLARAVESISQIPETHIETVSHAFESEPAYVRDQANFYNGVVEVTTSLEADALLERLLAIEDEMGRVREQENGPRVIDLDLLLYGEEEWHSAEITLPHPGLAERDFVVTPLLSIAPRVRMPDGTHLKPSAATEGLIHQDVGPIPDKGVARNQPVDADNWVVVASSEMVSDRVAGFDASLQIKAEVLEQEGIPFAWDPYEPGSEIEPFGFMTVFHLMVPETDTVRAKRLLEEFDAAAPPALGDVPAM